MVLPCVSCGAGGVVGVVHWIILTCVLRHFSGEDLLGKSFIMTVQHIFCDSQVSEALYSIHVCVCVCVYVYMCVSALCVSQCVL